MSKLVLTLCIIRRDDKILLGKKKRGFGAGRWNGFGGKVEAGESIEQAAIRETREECGIAISKLVERGVMTFIFSDDPVPSVVHIFEVLEFSGDPVETDEMLPQWFNLADIPYADMWEDDQYWLPLLLEGNNFTGTANFDSNHAMIDHDIMLRNA